MRYIKFILIFALLCSCSSREIDELFSEAKRHRAEGEYQEAIKTYSRIIALKPQSKDSRRAYLKMGHVYYHGLRDLPAALAVYRDLALLNPRYPEVRQARIHAAEILQKHLGNYRDAIGEYQKLQQENPLADDAPKFQMAIGDCYFALNDFKQSRIEYERLIQDLAVRKKPVLRGRGKQTLAVKDLPMRGYFQIAESYYMENHCGEAIVAYRLLIEKFPQSPYRSRAEFGMANCFEEEGGYDKALSLYQGLVDTYPSKDVIALKIKSLQERKKNSPTIPAADNSKFHSRPAPDPEGVQAE